MPSAFVLMEKLPLTPNGKIDRKSLPAPDMSHLTQEGSYVAPGSETEEKLARLWADLLKLERVGIYDNFFESGGHSLLGIWAVSRIQEEFGVDIPLQTLFENPTISGLANVLNAIEGSET